MTSKDAPRMSDLPPLDCWRIEQACRDCGQPFPYDPEADRCPACVADMLGEERIVRHEHLGDAIGGAGWSVKV